MTTADGRDTAPGWFDPLPRGTRPRGRSGENGDDQQPLIPVPAHAPEAIPPHRLGSPGAVWTYRDAAGRILMKVARFDRADGDKVILPLTFWRHRDGRDGWRWKALPQPRPL